MIFQFCLLFFSIFSIRAAPFSSSNPDFKDSSTFKVADRPLRSNQGSNVAFFVGNTRKPSTAVSVTPTPKTKLEEASTKSSLGVIGFQQSFSEPRAVNFGFFPVFPLPKHVEQSVDDLFPRRAQNEMFSPPRTDPRWSQFPGGFVPKLPNTLDVNFGRKPMIPSWVTTSTTMRPTTTTTVRATTTRFVAPNNAWDFAPLSHRRASERPEFPIGPPTTTTIAPSTTTRRSNSMSSPPGVAPPDWGRTHEIGMKPQKSFSPTIPKLFSSKSKNDVSIRKISLWKKEFSKDSKEKFIRCRTLDPLRDSILHPKTDKRCDQRQPQFQPDLNCRCRFIVADRDYSGCAKRFYSLCWQI